VLVPALKDMKGLWTAVLAHAPEMYEIIPAGYMPSSGYAK